MRNLLYYKNNSWEVFKHFEYTGSPEPFTLEPGQYLIKCEGAPGGTNQADSSKNFGGISMGVLNLTKSTKFYANVGGAGGTGTININPKTVGLGGYNGGADGGTSSSKSTRTGNGGGGATSIEVDIDDETLSAHGFTILKNLPDTYSELSYIENILPESYTIDPGDPDQGIDPTIITENPVLLTMRLGYIYYRNLVIECEGYVTTGYLFGYFNTCMVYVDNGKYAAKNANGSIVKTDISANSMLHTFILRSNKLTIDGVDYPFPEVNPPDEYAESSLVFFDRYIPPFVESANHKSSAHIKRIKIWNGSELTNDCIPVLSNVNNGIYFYDLIEQRAMSVYGDGRLFILGEIKESAKYYNRLIVAGGGGGTFTSISSLTPDYTGGGGGIVGSFTTRASITDLRYIDSRNLIDTSYIGNSDYITINDSETFTVTDASNAKVRLDQFSFLKTGKWYTISLYMPSDKATQDAFTMMIYRHEYPCTLIPASDGYTRCVIQFQYTGFAGNTYLHFKVACTFKNIQLEESQELTEYEPLHYRSDYYASQTFGASFGEGSPGAPGTSAGGGGGGWFGGEGGEKITNSFTSCGAGGSGYIFTESSYKPDGYLLDSSLYMTDTFFESCAAKDPGITIYKLNKTYSAGDVIEFPCVGWEESIQLRSGEYDLECFGGDGSCRYQYNAISTGGYASGTLNLINPVTLYCNVGGCGNGTSEGNAEFVALYHPTLSYNGGGPGSVNSNGTIDIPGYGWGGGATDFRLSPSTSDNSLYTRILVAGGAGGCGGFYSSTEYQGGVGGGETGGKSNGTRLSAGGNGGMQTEPESSRTGKLWSSTFGQGGAGLRSSSRYGGAGGGGWFGGEGVSPYTSGSDNNAGGGGGSGYVYTESSYKPDGYNVPTEYQLTSPSMIHGGSVDIGVAKATITIKSVNYKRLICRDAAGYKSFDGTSWVVNSAITTLDATTFETYGTYVFPTDAGLLDSYDILIYDNTTDAVYSFMIETTPPPQSISIDTSSRMLITEVMYDYDTTDEDCTITFTTSRHESDLNLHIDVIVDKPTIGTKAYIYTMQLFGKPLMKNARSEYRSEPTHGVPFRDPEQYRDEYGRVTTAQYLMPVAHRNDIDCQYTNYIGTSISDDLDIDASGWTIMNAVSHVYERLIYTMLFISISGSGNYIYIKTYSPMTGISKTVCSKQCMSGHDFYGDFLVDDKYFYLSQCGRTGSGYSTKPECIHRIRRDTNEFMISTSAPSVAGVSNDYTMYKTAFGKMEWFDDHRIMLLSVNQLLLYDTTKNVWETHELKCYTRASGTTSARSMKDYALGESLIAIMDTPNNNSGYYNLYLVNRNDLSDITVLDTRSIVTSSTAEDRTGVIMYHNGKFYVVYKHCGAVIDEQTRTIEEIISGMPWEYPAFITGNDKNLVIGDYYTSSISRIYVYNLQDDEFNLFYSQWHINKMGTLSSTGYSYGNPSTSTNIVRTVTIGGYSFIPFYSMGIVNITNRGMYDMGSKFDRYMLTCDESNARCFEFDDTFVSLTSNCIEIHDGIITKEFTPYTATNVKSVHVNKNEYRTMIKAYMSAKFN